ncbi:MAG: permease, partial [Proteobacteria bacterium]|nr:permease [Pseudomonadota bacterium]
MEYAQDKFEKLWLPIGVLSLALWLTVYLNLQRFAEWVAYQCLPLVPQSHLGSAVGFFIYEAPKVLMLLLLVVFGVGIVRSFFTPEKTRALLAGRRESAGSVLAALLGVVTPFCSCSAVPLFIGFVTSGVPLGVTFSFLVSAPMVNEIALVLLFGLFGWKIALLYMVTGLAIAMVSGLVIGKLGMEKYIEDWVYAARPVQTSCAAESYSLQERISFGLDAVRDIVGKVWPYVLAGIAVGAGIHGYVPENFMASIMGKSAWWSVPVAVLIG